MRELNKVQLAALCEAQRQGRTKIDYSMNTKYYRVTLKGATVGASVTPIGARHLVTKGAKVQEVTL